MKIRIKLLFRVLNKHQAQLASLSISEARQYFEKISQTPHKPRVTKVVEEHIGSNKNLKVRIYYTRSLDNPTIVYFHGGGFVLGSLDSHDEVARLLSRTTSSNVISVSYRLAPEYPFPAAIDSGITALAWLYEQDALNKSKVFLAGDSAGGHIALYTYLRLNKLAQKMVLGLILIYPSLDPALLTDSMNQYANSYFVTKSNMQAFWQAYLGKKHLSWPLAPKELRELPPVLVQTADFDILKDEGRLFAQTISTAGGVVDYHNYKGTTHGFMQMPTIINKRSAALKDIAHFMKSYKA